MKTLSLGQAAKLAKRGKTTLARAIKAGRLVADRRADGSYRIDPAELARAYELSAVPTTCEKQREAALSALNRLETYIEGARWALKAYNQPLAADVLESEMQKASAAIRAALEQACV